MRKSIIFFAGDGIPQLLTFRSKAWGDITMFVDDAMNLLKLMGHNGSVVPGALLAADIPATLARLKQELAAASPEAQSGQNALAHAQDRYTPLPSIALSSRAHPLIQLLTAAATQGCDVTWDEGHPAV
jgi:hypothetical protein